MKLAICLAATAAISALMMAQTPAAEQPSFEVVSIKPAPALTMPMITSGQLRSRIDDALVEISNISLMNLITMAYKVDQDYVSGPGWLADQNFAVAAKLPSGSSKSQVPAMLQRMLAERFKLAIHHTEKVQQVYLLTVGPQGIKLKESSDDGGTKVCQGRPGTYVCQSQTMAALARTLTMRAKMSSMMAQAGGPAQDDSQRRIDLPVIDQTGLTGLYDIDLEWIEALPGDGRGRGGAFPTQTSAPTAPDIFKALEQVGLKLEPSKHAFDAIVVDHIEKTPTEN
jgi:uncharacterized protein (TIGR03435 family)